MATKPKTEGEKLFAPDDPEQSKRFEEKAREIEADESGTQFKRALEALVPVKSSARKRRKSLGKGASGESSSQ